MIRIDELFKTGLDEILFLFFYIFFHCNYFYSPVLN